MSKKILETLEGVMKEEKVNEDLAKFLRSVVNFECFESTYRYKDRYRKMLEEIIPYKK